MTIRYTELPKLSNPHMVAAWPGIGNVGLGAVGYLVEQLHAKPFAEVDTSEFMLPSKVSIKGGLMTKMEFPYCRFFYRHGKRDLVLLVAEAQTRGAEESYNMLREILDFAELLSVRRIYTAAAAVTKVHHSSESQVWGIPNTFSFFDYLDKHGCLRMSEAGEEIGEGNITGLNGLLIGLAQSRHMDGICLLGEIPFYISSLPFTYPKGSHSVVRTLASMLDLSVDMHPLEDLSREVDGEIEELYSRLPVELKEELDKLKEVRQAKPRVEDFQKLVKDIEEFLKNERGRDQKQ